MVKLHILPAPIILELPGRIHQITEAVGDLHLLGNSIGMVLTWAGGLVKHRAASKLAGSDIINY